MNGMQASIESGMSVAAKAIPAPRKRSPKTEQVAKPSNKRAAASAVKKPRQPSLRFNYPKGLRANTLAVLTTLEKSKDGRQHRNALADVVVELTDSGMDYYFLRPLKVAEVGFFTQQTANLGMAATTRVLGSVIRNVIGGMDHAQLLSVCKYIRELMK